MANQLLRTRGFLMLMAEREQIEKMVRGADPEQVLHLKVLTARLLSQRKKVDFGPALCKVATNERLIEQLTVLANGSNVSNFQL
ncbi:hypothetical protein A2630_00815 [Candidatus Woesebacteria bacterium RIFCSPHIGHO2_01_FULL_44_10]|nr:MAG: hypothetical protein A2630_00815 [Candidatus Woesebacteria bacterium RIFCSPHIGHO2_01_FULL_44_10]